MDQACSCKTWEQSDAKFDQILLKQKDVKGNLIPILHDIQELYGYIPRQSLEKLSKTLRISLSEIYGVITFYHHFSLEPKGEYNISVCMGTACYVKGAGDILEAFKEKLGIEIGQTTKDNLFSLQGCRCLGACGLAPVILVNDKVHGRLKKEDVGRILQEYRDFYEERVVRERGLHA